MFRFILIFVYATDIWLTSKILFLRFKSVLKRFKFFYFFKLIFFLVFLDHFNVLILKIIF